ncbi:hypothetical protein RHSIM_Rhsim02G0235600 [Rhododendron simsii]|uniref:DET1- and DDB1-associated protein 1 domain-containing protein n=1 Tax=Rhododendron simsii TaxID=118357 RepID=A0A834HFW7_RHOSS|nr:hypothetical protein RHSIM_Rhsim02G0235600 [Rhododendron simsii]
MGSMLGDWPSFDPHNFSQLRPSDPSNPSVRKYASVSARYVGGFALFSKFCKSGLNLDQGTEMHFLILRSVLGLGVLGKMTPVTYHPTHDRTLPPPNQVITSEAKNILLRHFYQRAEDKLRSKRSASENLTPEHGSKHPRATASDMPPN